MQSKQELSPAKIQESAERTIRFAASKADSLNWEQRANFAARTVPHMDLYRREHALRSAAPSMNSFEQVCKNLVEVSNMGPDAYAPGIALRALCEKLENKPQLRDKLSDEVKAAVKKILAASTTEFANCAKNGLAVKESEFRPQATDRASILMDRLERCSDILGENKHSLPYDQLAKLCMRAAQLELNDAGSSVEGGDFAIASAGLALRYVSAARDALSKGEIETTPAIERFFNRVETAARAISKG